MLLIVYECEWMIVIENIVVGDLIYSFIRCINGSKSSGNDLEHFGKELAKAEKMVTSN